MSLPTVGTTVTVKKIILKIPLHLEVQVWEMLIHLQILKPQGFDPISSKFQVRHLADLPFFAWGTYSIVANIALLPALLAIHWLLLLYPNTALSCHLLPYTSIALPAKQKTAYFCGMVNIWLLVTCQERKSITCHLMMFPGGKKRQDLSPKGLLHLSLHGPSTIPQSANSHLTREMLLITWFLPTIL